MRAAEQTFRDALKIGVTIGNGSDVGVFPHGENWRELDWMVKDGMTPVQALHAATDVAASILRQSKTFGRIAPGLRADIAGFDGDPSISVTALQRPVFVMKDGVVYRQPGVVTRAKEARSERDAGEHHRFAEIASAEDVAVRDVPDHQYETLAAPAE